MKSLGIDCVLISRVERLVHRRRDSHAFAKRILTDMEYKVFFNKLGSANFLAGRFALKEAAFKALSSAKALRKEFSFKDVETSVAFPSACVYLPTGQYLLSSLSHDGNLAIAVTALVE